MTTTQRLDGRERAIDIPGATLAAKTWGEVDGLPVLASHGWLDNAATFDRLAPLMADKLHIVSIDFPGHGQSDHLARGSSYHFVDLVPTIFDVADSLGWERFRVLGHSMGAVASTLAAGTLPDRIERLALIDGLGPTTTEPELAPAQLADAIGERKELLTKSSRVFESREAARKTIGEIYQLTTDEVAPLMERGLEQTDAGWQLTYDLALRATSMLRLTDAHVRAFFGRIEAPVLLIRPENGWPVDPDRMEEQMSWIDDLTLRKVAGNHHAHLAHPEAIADAVRDFLVAPI